MDPITNFIDGALRAPASGRYLENLNPATGEAYGLVPDSEEADVAAAVAAAARAFPSWSRKEAEERCAVLWRLAGLVERDLEKLAVAESIDTGKPLWLARSVDIT